MTHSVRLLRMDPLKVFDLINLCMHSACWRNTATLLQLALYNDVGMAPAAACNVVKADCSHLPGFCTGAQQDNLLLAIFHLFIYIC